MSFSEDLLKHQRGGILGSLKKGAFLVLRASAGSVSALGAGREGQSCSRTVLTGLCACRHQLETPGHYSHLAAFYEDKKGVLHTGPGRGGSLPPVCWLPSIHRYMYPEMKVRSACCPTGQTCICYRVSDNFF